MYEPAQYRKTRGRGFTLLELVITLAIVSLLTMVAMPLAQLVVKREKEAQLRTALRDIRSAIDKYQASAKSGHIKLELGASGYPPDLKSLYAGVADQTSATNVNLYFLRSIPRDPFYPEGSAAAEETWGLRSSQSPPDDPQPGDDVFDVYSLSKAVGLNGVPYHDW